MKIIGEQSLSSVLYLVVTVVKYLILCAIGVIILRFGLLFFDDPLPGLKILIEVPVSFEPTINNAGGDLIAVSDVKLNTATLIEEYPGIFILLQSIGIGLMLYLLYGVELLRSFLSRVKENIVFTQSNFNCLRKIAFLIILSDPLRWFIHLIYSTSLSSVIPGVQFSISFPADLMMIFTGSLLLVFTEIFRCGFLIYEEQKLTV